MPAPARLSRRTRLVLGSAMFALVGLMIVLVTLRPRTAAAMAVGDLTILVATLLAVAGCLRAARRGGPSRRGWQVMAFAIGVWASGQILWTFYGLTRDHVYPFPSIADALYVGYSLPAAAALLLFPRTAARGVSRFRVVLDALVIASSLLLMSWVTVLGTLTETAGTGLTRVVSLGYPIADVLVGSLVLALGMRAPAGSRRPWLFIGIGLLVLAITDSFYVSLTAHGDTGLTGTALGLGWVGAFLLMAFAGQLPAKPTGPAKLRHYTVVQELLPYLPLVAAIVAVASSDRRFNLNEPFLLANGALVVGLFALQQLLIAVEKVQLANGLEGQVAARTAEATAAADRVRSLVEYSDDAIIVKSPTGLVLSWNPAAERIYGYLAQEMVGRSILGVIPEHLHAQELRTSELLRSGAPVPNYETERIRQDGSTLAVSLTASPVIVNGIVEAISAISHDISERKRQEAELAEARIAALEASRAKSEFLATMSHEIRTPMNGVIGLTDLLLDTQLDTVQRRYAAGVRGAGEALLSIIDDILDFSKLEAGKVELEERDYDPRQLVEEVGQLLAMTAAAKGLELVAYCDPDMPSALAGDAGRLRQILLNLVSNAVKFTEHGEVVLRGRLAPRSGGRTDVEFIVIDTGIGMTHVDQDRMFEPFSQADASTTRRFGGTGLGLAICRRLVEAMGGELRLDSELGLGSTFRFTVPMKARPTLGGRREPRPGLLTGLSVLVVDDNQTNRLILATQLTAWGMRPVVAADGASGLQILQEGARNGTPFVMALLDLCMPDMDGLELAMTIAADHTLGATRTMMLSSAGPVGLADAARAQLVACISKPVRQSELYDSLVRLADPDGLNEPADTHVTKAMPAADDSGWRGRVLVVEDNHVNQLVAEGVLRKLGYAVEMACNGAEGLVAMAALSFDAVLMDCHMPEMDGFAATIDWRRREAEGQHLPIIAMTAGVLAEDRERCVAAGMDDFVAKPIEVGRLERALSRWVIDSGGGRASSAVRPATPVAQEIAAVDQARLDILRRIGPDDGWGLLPTVVEAFLSEVPEQHAAIVDAARGGDLDALASAAHKLQGAAANLGATTVAGICGDLVAMARLGSTLADTAVLARLERELTRAGAALAGEVVGHP